MLNVVGVSFSDNGRIYYFDANGFKIRENVTVIVETEHGLQFGKIVKTNHQIEEKKLKSPLKKIIRISKKEDYKRHIKNQKDAKEALKQCRKLVEEKALKMFLIDASYTFDRDKLIFRFLADSRVDFRELAKDLASIYKVRIELRQIGVRDKAKEVGGCGPCGQKLCCARFLKELDTVSISMAKNQNIALNPSKINGACGRLMCCLKYEDDNYTECRKCLPKIGDKVDTDSGKGKVVNLDILKKSYNVELENNKGIVSITPDGSN